MAKPTSRSCDIVLRRYVLISFNFEKVLSHDTTVAGRTVNILSATDRFIRMDKNFLTERRQQRLDLIGHRYWAELPKVRFLGHCCSSATLTTCLKLYHPSFTCMQMTLRLQGKSHLLLIVKNYSQIWILFSSEWVSSFLTAHQHIIGYFSALQWREYRRRTHRCTCYEEGCRHHALAALLLSHCWVTYDLRWRDMALTYCCVASVTRNTSAGVTPCGSSLTSVIVATFLPSLHTTVLFLWHFLLHCALHISL